MYAALSKEQYQIGLYERRFIHGTVTNRAYMNAALSKEQYQIGPIRPNT